MSTAPQSTTALTAAAAGPRALAKPAPAESPLPVRRLAAWLARDGLPRAAWAVGRTGRRGIAGIALLLATAVFWVSTHLQVAGEVDAMRGDLAAAQGRARRDGAGKAAGAEAAVRALPARTDMPAILRQVFSKAAQAKLTVDTGKYEISPMTGGGIVRYQLAFPVSGTYPQVRSFIDSTLATMPAVALNELAIERKAIGDASVEAQIRMTVFTGAPLVARAASDRVVTPTQAAALFAPHSWYVAPPPPPPAPPPRAPDPTAPPLPYTLIGSYAPDGQKPVFFLAHGDRMIDAHVGDHLDGVYLFESASASQLVFVYLPLNTRQTLAAGAPQ